MKKAGTLQRRIRKREKILFELLNSSLAQLGPERSDTQRDSFEASGVLCTKAWKIRQATALYYTIPAFGKYNSTSHWGVCQCFTISKSWRHLLFGGRPFDKLYRFLSATLFERVPIYGRWKQSTPRTTLVENGNQLIDFYSTSDRAVTGSFGGSISVLTLERLGVAFPYEQWRNNVLFNDDRNGTLKQSNGNDQMVLILDPACSRIRCPDLKKGHG